MEWKEYVQELLNTESEFDVLTVALNNESDYIRVPPIIKASILLLDTILSQKSNHNIFVFPEKNQTGFLFMLMKLFHNILHGKIEHVYDPRNFYKGEKLKLGNAVVEFVELTTQNEKSYIKLLNADVAYSAPIDIVPHLQHTDTAKKLSSDKIFSAAKKELNAKIKLAKLLKSPVTEIENNKSHMESSIFYMSPIIRTKSQLMGCSIDNEPVLKIMMVAQTNYEGTIRIIGPGQLKGVPAIVLSSDLYSIEAAIERGNPVQSLILDISQENQIEAQLDVLDRLCLRDFPILCYTDTANSTNLSILTERGFNVWRWDAQSLDPLFYSNTGSGATLLEQRLQNCDKQTITYALSNDSELMEMVTKIFARKKEINDMPSQLQNSFASLSRLIFTALRATIGSTLDEQIRVESELKKIETALTTVFSYISPEALKDYKTSVHKLHEFFKAGNTPAKHGTMLKQLKLHEGEDICIVIPEHTDKGKVKDYWHRQCLINKIKTRLEVYHPSDYIGTPLQRFHTTIIVGWFSRGLMRKLIFSYKTQNLVVLLYPQENKWCRFDERRWKKAFRETSSSTVVRRFLSTENRTIAYEEPEAELYTEDDTGEDQSQLENILHEGKYKRVSSSQGQSGSQLVSAFPVNFVGEYEAFFRPGHRLISATRIITEDADKIQSILPDKLAVGDFIVVREADRDLIREIADKILEREGKTELRTLAGKWRDSLKIELLFTSIDEFYNKLKNAGCTKGKATVKNWCNNEDIIAPQDKDDLRLIAEVSGDQVLIELLDNIYNAARDVKAAHTQAGMELSTLLHIRIPDELKKYGDIDPYNLWEPIEIDIEGIGLVRILKVIDVNDHHMISVDTAMTNRVMSDS